MSVLKFPKFPDWKDLEDIDYEGSFWDSQELDNLNTTLIKTVLDLKSINKEITKYDRKRVQLETEYKQKFRASVLSSNAKTETQKKQMAEIQCQDLEVKLAYIEEVLRELNRLSSSLRTDLDVLKTIGFNLRQELKL